jgi:hypothetical protein
VRNPISLKKNWFLIIIAFPMTKKNSKPKKKTSKIMTNDIVQTNQCLEHGFKSYLRIALVND